MFFIILLIAGVALAANRKQQAGATPATPVSGIDTTVLPSFKYISDIFNPRAVSSDAPTGPGIGTGLAAIGTGSVSPIVSGPYISVPGVTAVAPGGGSAPGGGGTSGGTIPSGTGSGGTGFTGPGGFRTPSVL